MSIVTTERPTTPGPIRMTTMVSPSTRRIFRLSAQLRHDLEEPERKRLLADIRDLRRALSGLEYEVRGETDSCHGDAS